MDSAVYERVRNLRFADWSKFEADSYSRQMPLTSTALFQMDAGDTVGLGLIMTRL
ncbi:hypothetical protein [Sporosarcina luteola]|uniref:hypothetical protein n=1 Tax=Sporosarcina luteola TaxID=582850 RepID=UPI002040F25D|nr:hypothetical protein [Sporosarcina luteola]MCM3709258.1 hypothetical protein [Sporosarcina luteola]